jgi:hypothetical protein
VYTGAQGWNHRHEPLGQGQLEGLIALICAAHQQEPANSTERDRLWDAD